MVPTAVTIHDERAITTLARAGISKKADPKFAVAATLGIYAGFILICCILFAFAGDWSSIKFVLFLLAMLVVMLIARYILNPKRLYKGQGKLKDIKITYTFLPDRMTNYAAADGYKEQSEIGYDMLYLVKETSEYFLVYRGKASAYIIDKSHLYNCNADTVRQLLLSGGAKYILCNY